MYNIFLLAFSIDCRNVTGRYEYTWNGNPDDSVESANFATSPKNVSVFSDVLTTDNPITTFRCHSITRHCHCPQTLSASSSQHPLESPTLSVHTRETLRSYKERCVAWFVCLPRDRPVFHSRVQATPRHFPPFRRVLVAHVCYDENHTAARSVERNYFSRSALSESVSNTQTHTHTKTDNEHPEHAVRLCSHLCVVCVVFVCACVSGSANSVPELAVSAFRKVWVNAAILRR